ncbi:hypothetical protein ACE1CI_18155 [Aerosakkonemataceae cyanobacterium BLCC-F50]|uniref:Uncharacterized protein n=1 Tax=Floridaenema flaviceps BLCC-F50 TaxID=3153642 RepID=A0ABV4XTR8_9CYAN
MKPETEQLLGTLEVLVGNTFVWETEIQGEFNAWNLAIAQGFVSLTDVDEAIAHWQSVERWGTPTDQSKNDYEYAPKRNERKDGWNAEIEAKRFDLYQQLSQLLKAHLQELQAFIFSVTHKNNDDFEWHHANYCFYIIIGKTDDENWLCFSPTVPDQVTSYSAKHSNSELAEATDIKLENALALDLQSRIHNTLLELPPITLYGYYDGGYKYKYQHQIVYSIATQKSVAIELALQAARMLQVEKTNIEYASDDFNSRKLSQFLNSQLSDRTIYTLSFWDIGYTYEIGKTPTGDWLGVKTQLEFEYNP